MKKYSVIYADPPWKYQQDKKNKNFRAVTSEHYDTLTTEQLCSLNVKDILEDSAICLMWATFPLIQEAFKVMEAWGFEYKTCGFVWVKKTKDLKKNAWGMGFYTRSNAEVCLIGIKKKSKAIDLIKSHAVHQIVETVRLRHSEKPQEVRDKILELCGDVPRIELFAREKVKGWDVWGNEVVSDAKLEFKKSFQNVHKYRCICNWSKDDEYGFIPNTECLVHGKRTKKVLSKCVPIRDTLSVQSKNINNANNSQRKQRVDGGPCLSSLPARGSTADAINKANNRSNHRLYEKTWKT